MCLNVCACMCVRTSYLRLAAVQGWLRAVIGGPLSTPDILWKGDKGQQVINMGALATNAIRVSRGAWWDPILSCHDATACRL